MRLNNDMLWPGSQVWVLTVSAISILAILQQVKENVCVLEEMRVKRMWFNEPLHINIFHTNITTYYSLCGNVTLGIGRYSYPQHLVSLLEVSRTVETSGGGWGVGGGNSSCRDTSVSCQCHSWTQEFVQPHVVFSLHKRDKICFSYNYMKNPSLNNCQFWSDLIEKSLLIVTAFAIYRPIEASPVSL